MSGREVGADDESSPRHHPPDFCASASLSVMYKLITFAYLPCRRHEVLFLSKKYCVAYKNKQMISFDLPSFPIKTIQQEGRTYLFDFLRKRYVRLTPEEWVRQHFTHFLITYKHYPPALLANEVTLRVSGASRRCDSVLYHREGGLPRAIIEYKAPHVPVSAQVFQQICAYNSVLRADYLMISNGATHFCCHIDYTTLHVTPLPEIPDYADLR